MLNPDVVTQQCIDSFEALLKRLGARSIHACVLMPNKDKLVLPMSFGDTGLEATMRSIGTMIAALQIRCRQTEGLPPDGVFATVLEGVMEEAAEMLRFMLLNNVKELDNTKDFKIPGIDEGGRT